MPLLLIVILVLLAVPTASESKSVGDPHIGWSSSLRRELKLEQVRTTRCEKHSTAAGLRLQSRIARRDPSDAIRAIFHYRWGNAWYDHCDGGRLKIGVPPKPASGLRERVARARRVVAQRRLQRDVRFVAVRSSYRELSDAQNRLEELFDQLLQDGLISTGIDTTRNTVEIDVARPVSDDDRSRLKEAALDAPVNVVLNRVDADNLGIDPY